MINNITLEWLMYAISDLAAAKNLPGDRTQYRNVVYHCHQAAEKALKGYLVGAIINRPQNREYVNTGD